VLLAMGLDGAQASSSLRLSLSRWTTEREVDAALEILERSVRRLRALSGSLGASRGPSGAAGAPRE
jgi:cysteine desulfurase